MVEHLVPEGPLYPPGGFIYDLTQNRNLPEGRKDNFCNSKLRSLGISVTGASIQPIGGVKSAFRLYFGIVLMPMYRHPLPLR